MSLPAIQYFLPDKWCLKKHMNDYRINLRKKYDLSATLYFTCQTTSYPIDI